MATWQSDDVMTIWMAGHSEETGVRRVMVVCALRVKGALLLPGLCTLRKKGQKMMMP